MKDFVNSKESDGKDRQFYASLGVSRQFGDGERDGEREQQTANERLKGEGYQYMARDKFSLRLAEAKNNTDKNPSQAQKESGNYRKGHIRFGGYNYTIENPQGSYRSGVDENGKKWKQKMNNTYGYILGTKGKDGDHLDMFINDKADLDSWNGNVYVVDQVFPDGTFDEHKVMYGFESEEDARKAYLSNYEQGWQGLGNITGVSKEDFDRWLEKIGRKTKAFGEYKNVKSESAESPKTGAFGTIYTQFRGKAQEALDFLASHGSGDLLGVFHREGVGDIDAVWGDKGGGLDHIIRKHIGDGKSFHSIVEAANVIDDIIKTGSKAFENGDKIVFKKGSKLVTIRKNVRENGKKIADKNWVLTAYDELSADGDVSAIAPVNQGQAARTTGKSQRKDTIKPSNSQKKNVKSNKRTPFSLKNDRTLAGVHNITEEKLRKALKLGGFANPSVAVIDTSKNGHEKFGEISLIAPSALVDKESGHTAGTWTTDAYTQRYPSVERQMSDKGYDKFCKWVDGLDFTDSEKAEIKRQATDALEDNREPAWELMYLKEKGIDIKAYSSDVNYAWEPVVETYGSVDDVLKAMESDAELDEKVRKLVKVEITSPLMNTIRNTVRHQIHEETGKVPSPVNPAVRKRVREIFDKEYAPKLFDENGQVKSDDVRKVVGEMLAKYNDTKRFSFQKAKAKASTYVHNNGMYTDYLRWQEEKLEDYGTKGRIFRGYKNDGTRRYLPETLENVSKAMSEDADGETNGSEYTSFGSFIAKLAPHVDSTEEMRSSKDKLSSAEEEKKEFYDKWEDTYYALAKELYNDVFYGEKRLHDIVLQKDPKRYAKKEYGITLSASFMKNLDTLKKAIREDLKSLYFETKFERPVHLDEFAAAVVPTTASNEVKQALQNAGVQIFEYDKEKEGDRSRAFNEAINSSDTIRFSLDKDKGTVVSPSKPSKAEAVLRDAVIDRLRENGMEVITDVAEGQKVLDEANGEDVMLSAKQKRALETATMADESTNKATVVSSADGAKVQNNLEILADSYKNRPNKTKGFITDLSRSLGLEQHEASQYGTFVTENGKTFTIRVSNHNARVSFFDKNGENNGISIVISNHKNKGLLNDGNAHIIEFFYSKQSLQRADSKPLSDIIRSVSETLYSGEFKDTTGLAERQEVNAKKIREQRVYHGSGADGVRFFRTANGEAYGFTVGGRIYVDPRIATSETPVHEYAHLWATALRSGNKEEWRNVVGLMKDSKVWDEVKGRYPELKTDDEIADEVIATYSGRRGAERLREEQRKIAEGDGGVFEKAEAISALEHVKRALKMFWKGVADFLHIHYKSAEEVADRVMKDLLEGVDPRSMGDGVDRQRYASLGVSRSLGEREDMVRYQFIGEKGAAEADHAEEVSVRLDNLSVAREMEAEKKDAKAIKMATGWERGADGKWRYEIADSKLNDMMDVDGKGKMVKRHEEDMLWTSGKLGEVVVAPELFKAYPKLKDVRLETDSIMNNLPSNGEYNAKTNTITIHADELKYLNSILNHEIQHAIQYLEGFARGGSSMNVRRRIQRIIDAEQDASDYAKGKLKEWVYLKMAAERLENLYEKYIHSDNAVLKGKAIDAYWDAMNEVDNHADSSLENVYPDGSARDIAESGYHVDEVKKELRRLSQEAYDAIPEGNMDALHLVRKLENALEYKSDEELYHSLGGEVEARNVQERMGMSAEERRASLAAETEDVAREDQIFLMGDGVSNQQTLRNVNNQSLFDAIHTLYSKGKAFAEKIYKRKFFDVAETPDFMKRLGLTGDKFTIRYGVISRHFGKDNQHDFTEEEWNKIPKALSNPILITEYYQDEQQKRQKGYRLYTPLKLADGSYVVVSAEVKNAGKNLEINAINTIFGRNAISDIHDRIIYQNPKITPEQSSLLNGNNPHQYPTGQELSDANVDNSSETAKESDGKDRQRYASLGVSRPLGEDAAEGEPRWASSSLSEPRGEREQRAANERFNNELTRYQNGEMDKNEMLHLGRPQGVMRTFLPNLPIVMRQRVIKKGSEKKHEVDVSAIMNMPQHLSSPIFVFQRSEDTIGVLTDKRDRNGKNVCVAIELKRQIQQGAEYLEVNDVRSFHGREFKNIVEPIANNKTLKWVDKEKGLAYLSSASQPVQQEIDKQVLDTATKVVKDFVNPKESEGKDRQRWTSWSLSEQQLDGDDTVRFSLRQEPAPKVTKKGYAVFIYKKLKNGGYKLVPKMLSNDPGAPAQTWLNADTGYMKRDENGEPLQNTNGRASVSVNGSQAGGNKSNKLAWRPGKHLAMYPNASQFKSPDGTIPKDVIFFEVEYAADPDLHKQYQRNAWELGMNDNGQYRNNQGGLPYIPKDSYYLYRTNSISEGATPMIITGAYKINRALTDAEAKELNQNAGGMWCPRKGGDLTEEKLKDMGLDDKGLKKMTESFDMDTIKESHDESDEARLLPGYKSREINWEDKDLIHSIEENGQDINDYRDGYVAPEHSEEPTIRFSLDKDKGTVVSPSKPSKAEAVLRDAVIDRLRENGMEVITDVAEGQKVLDEANGEDVMLSAKQKRALETATIADESTNNATVVSSADGAKVQNNLEILADYYEKRPNKTRGFITDLSRSLGLVQHEASQYGTFETRNGKLVTIRVSNHNARVSFFDENGEEDGISIVISSHKNKGVLNDGNAHIIEFFYSKQSLQRADSKPLSDIIRSVSETLYSGEFKDTTGLAERQEVNAKKIREQRVYHGSGAHPLLSELRKVEQRDVIMAEA